MYQFVMLLYDVCNCIGCDKNFLDSLKYRLLWDYIY